MYSLEEALHSQHQDWKIPKFIMDTRYQLHIYKNMGLYLKKKIYKHNANNKTKNL